MKIKSAVNSAKTSMLFTCLFSISIEAYSYDVIFTINNQQYVHTIDESNDGASAFREALPITVTFEDYGFTERIAYLEQKLKNFKANPSCDPIRGDFTYYVPWGNLAVFIQDFRHSDNLLYISHLEPDLVDAIQKSQKSAVIIEEK